MRLFPCLLPLTRLLLLFSVFPLLLHGQSQCIDTREKLIDLGARWSVPPHEAPHYASFFFDDQGLELSGTDIGQKADAFWRLFGSAWTLTHTDLKLVRERVDPQGGHHFRYQQLLDGLAIPGAELQLHFAADGRLRAGGGFYHDQDYFGVTLRGATDRLSQVGSSPPTIHSEVKQEKWVSTSRPSTIPLQASDYLPQQANAHQWQISTIDTIYAIPGLIVPDGSFYPVAALQLRLESPATGHGYECWVDLQTGRLIQRLPLHCGIMERHLYEGNIAEPNQLWAEGEPLPANLDPNHLALLRHTEQSYNLFYRTFGFDSYDDEGGPFNIVYEAQIINNCPNANAGIDRINLCADVVADDVTAHEWTHLYISHSSALIYLYESGAINESLADIFGEVVDLINGEGNDTDSDVLRQSCDDLSTRWKVAEDVASIETHARDMAFPNCREDPNSRADTLYYCGDDSFDDGGVHINSGLVNKLFVLLVDGGSLHGVTVEGIGMTRAAHLMAQVLFYYNSRVTDFYALADELRLAGQDLLDVPLLELTVDDEPAAVHPTLITSDELAQLELAIQAVGLQSPPICDVDPLLVPYPVAPCSNVEQIIFEEDWEEGLARWQLEQQVGQPLNWQNRSWEISGRLPQGRDGQAAFGITPHLGHCNDYQQQGTIDLISPLIDIPEGAENIRLVFDHYLSMEERLDGGLLYLRRNHGPWIYCPDYLFDQNGYTHSLLSWPANNNPEAGKYSFTGSDENSTTGSWASSLVDLSEAGYMPGDDMQIMFRVATNACHGLLGWYVDDIKVSYCTTPTPVEWLSFTAHKQHRAVQLNWATASEVNNSGFWIERSVDGRQFEQIAWVAAALSSQSGASYSYLDDRIGHSSSYYYRLRQLDFDGSQQLSDVRHVDWSHNGAGWQLWPNPARGWLNLDLPTAGLLQIYRMDGRLLEERAVAAGLQQIGLSKLSQGMYLLRFGDQVHKVVIR